MNAEPSNSEAVAEKARRALGVPIGREAAHLLADRLLVLPQSRRRAALRVCDISTGVLVARELSSRTLRLTGTDPVLAVAAGRDAVWAANSIYAHGSHRAVVWDTRAAAYGRLANALRVRERYAHAWAVWRKVERCLHRGTGDVDLEAELLVMRGLLERGQRDFASASKHLLQAAEVSEAVGNEGLAAKARAALAATYLYAQEPSSCASESLRALALASRVRSEPDAVMGTLHNFTLASAELGQPAVALWTALHTLPHYLAAAPPQFLVRLHWFLGKLASSAGDARGAADALDEVRRDLLARKLPYDASLASLDLAVVYLELGQHAEVRRLAEEMYSVFRAKAIPREASAALLLFAEAARREQCTVDSVSSLISDLKTRLAPAGKSLPAGKFVT